MSKVTGFLEIFGNGEHTMAFLAKFRASTDDNGVAKCLVPAKAVKMVNGPFNYSDVESSVIEVIKRVREGYDVAMLDDLASRLRIRTVDLCELATIPDAVCNAERGRTKLTSAMSDRLYRIESVLELAIYVLESEDGAIEWLNNPIPSLRDSAPISMLDTDLGVKLVKDVLNRLEYSMVS